MKTAVKFLLFVMPFWATVLSTQAPAQITSVTLGPEQIATIKTATANTTRVAFPDKIEVIICGDLYDEQSGKGTFVIQKGENDFFIKPVAAKGQSNLFVKTADGKKTYNFKLEVVAANQAHFTVNVLDPRGSAASPENPPPTNSSGAPCITEADLERRKSEVEQAAQLKADAILRKAREDASRLVNDAEERVAEINRKATDTGTQETERRFLQAILTGVQKMTLGNTRANVRKISLFVDPEIFVFGDKAYLRYTIHNTSDKEFTYTAIALEAGAPKAQQPIPVELTQSKAENTLAPTESLSGVVVFDFKLLAPKDKLSLLIRGDENAELIRLNM